MRTKHTLLMAVCAVVALMVSAASPRVQSASSIVWETTFNCPDWNQTMGLRDGEVCATGDGIEGWGGWSTANGNYDSITAAANFPGGWGGKGFRHMQGDGTNNNGGGLRIVFLNEQVMTELWVRYYMRRKAGFTWANDQPHYTKDLYFNDRITTEPVFTMGYSFGRYGINIVRPGSFSLNAGDDPIGKWETTMGGPTGDGLWHAYEVHVKMDTNGSNGIGETWIDGVLIDSRTNVDWGAFNNGWNGWRFFSMGINQHDPTNGGADVYTDFDDIAVSGSGYIGPIGVPTAPTNVRITS